MKRPAPPDPGAGKFGASKPGRHAGVDVGLVRALGELLSKLDLSEIEVEEGDLRIRVSRQSAGRSAHAAAAPAAAVVPLEAAVALTEPVPVAAADHPGVVKSPMVGTVYRRASPEAKAFVDIGSVVKAGDRVLLVEAMKTFNDIVTLRGGTVSEILVEDGQPVEYGQPLLIIE